MSESIIHNHLKDIATNCGVKAINDAKTLERKDKSAVVKAGIKYAIAKFLNETTGSKFSFLRNWEKNSANHLLMQINNVFSKNIADQIKQCENKVQEWTRKCEPIKFLKHFKLTHDFVVLGQRSLQYCSDILAGPTNNLDPQTVNRLLCITGTLYQENEVLKSVMDQVKNDILQLAFSEETINNLFDKLNLNFISKPANRLIVLLGIKDKIDDFFTKEILNNEKYNLNKKDLVNAEEKLLYKTLSFFANYNGDKWSDEDIKKLFDETTDPFLKGILENYEEIEKLYKNNKLMQLLSKTSAKFCKTNFLNSILKSISKGQPIDKLFIDILEQSCTSLKNCVYENIKDTAAEVSKNCVELKNNAIKCVKDIAKQPKKFYDEYNNNMPGNIDLSGKSAIKEAQDFLNEAEEQCQGLVKTCEEKLKSYFNDKAIDKIKNPEEAIQKHEDRAKRRTIDNLNLYGIGTLFMQSDGSLSLSELQKDFVAQDVDIRALNDEAENLQSIEPIEDKGLRWNETYHLARSFQNMLMSDTLLSIEIDGESLESNDEEKVKVLNLKEALVDNPGNTDGSSIIKTLSLLADEGTLLRFIPENIKNKFETYGLRLCTYETSRILGDLRPHINLKINKKSPMEAEINVSWPLLNSTLQPTKHTFGLNFTSVLDLKNEGKGWIYPYTEIKTTISSIKDLQYTFDGEKINETKDA